MWLVIASLGRRLRQISKEAHISLAMLTVYLNDVWYFIFYYSVMSVVLQSLFFK